MKEILKFEQEYKKLNPEQKEAVDTIYGPVMVVAGPGTGKTQIIASRTANILAKTDVSPSNIFITTFTDAGVIAIRKRLISFLGKDAYKVQVATIHSFASDVIKTFPEKFIKFKASRAIDEVEILEIIKKILEQAIEKGTIEALTSDYEPLYYLRTIASKISTLKLEGVTKERFKRSIEKQKNDYVDELAEINPKLKKYNKTKEKQEKDIKKLEELLYLFEQYNDYLREDELYDFNDMINFVLEAFKEDKELVYHYSEQFQFIMLDEYQDTNNAQNQIIDLILGETEDTPNIMVVGDDDQSIYRFQGANIENMLEFSTYYPETKFVVLKNNYRSTPAILEAAKSLIENNNERLSNKITSIDKQIISAGAYKSIDDKPKLYKANSDIDEQAFIVSEIQELLSKGHDISDIAIITRSNKELELYAQLLSQNDIPSESKLQSNILDSDYVTLIIKLLTVIENPGLHDTLLIDIVRADLFGLNKIDIYTINRILYSKNYSRKYKLSFIDFLNELETLNIAELENYNFHDLDQIIYFKNKILELHSDLGALSLQEFMHKVVESLGIIDYIDTYINFDVLQDVYTFFNKIKSFIEADKYLTLEKLLHKIQLYKNYNYKISRQILREKKEGIQLMTAHSSKGLEFETVFIPGLNTGSWDNKRKRDLIKLPIYISSDGIQNTDFDQIEEDRRLFFVAITRAKRNLFLSYPAGSGTKPLLESLFIEELQGNYDLISERNNLDKIKQITTNSLINNTIVYDNQEFDYIEQFLENYKLSPSDLNIFIEDPLLFLNRVVFKYPFEDNRFTIFGKVYHRTLELFYLKFKKEGKLPELGYLTATFTYLLEKEAVTHQEFEDLLQKGISGLQGYYDLYKDKKEAPLVLEYSFRRKNIYYKDIPLTGTIDKIEKSSSSELSVPTAGLGQAALFQEKVNLVDYKTGKIKTIGNVKGIDRYGNKKDDTSVGKYFRQLLFYKLLCEMDSEFHSQFQVASLALDFVEGKEGRYKYLEVPYSQEEFDFFLNELQQARAQISDIKFWETILKQ